MMSHDDAQSTFNVEHTLFAIDELDARVEFAPWDEPPPPTNVDYLPIISH
jgi:hypothetical protein